jgi:hypothetical protein
VRRLTATGAAGRGRPVGGDGEKGWSEPVASAKLPMPGRLDVGEFFFLMDRDREVSQARPNWEGAHLTPHSAPDTAHP